MFVLSSQQVKLIDSLVNENLYDKLYVESVGGTFSIKGIEEFIKTSNAKQKNTSLKKESKAVV